MDAAHVDLRALVGTARQYQAVAESLDDAVRTHLTGLRFGGASAGREYIARGDSVRTSVEDLAGRVRAWSRACNEIAAALRASVDRYADADARAADRMGR